MNMESAIGDEACSWQCAAFSSVPGILPAVFIVCDDSSVWRSAGPTIGARGLQVETFASIDEFLSFPLFYHPGCLVLDISSQNLKGLGLQKRLADSDRAYLPIILATGYGDVLMTIHPMKAEFADLVAPLEGEGLLGVIGRAIACSKVVIQQQKHVQALRARHGSLSRRERQVMALVAAGLLNRQVGRELGISEITVKAHRGRVMQKMQARSLAELVKMATRVQEDAGRRYFAAT
jgi:FixJ family two-component response regulator